jgi:hypothetical protein
VFYQIHYRGPAFRIGHSSHVAARFIEREINVALRPVQQLAIHFDVIGFRISLAAKLGYHLAIHGDASACNQFFCFAA